MLIMALLSSHLSNVNWLHLFTSVSPDNIKGNLANFLSVVMGSIKTYVPLRHGVNNFNLQQYPTYT